MNEDKWLNTSFIRHSFISDFIYFPLPVFAQGNAGEALQVFADFRHAVHVGRIKLSGQLMSAGDLERRVLRVQGCGEMHFLGDALVPLDGLVEHHPRKGRPRCRVEHQVELAYQSENS